MEANTDYERSYTCSLHPKDARPRADVLGDWAKDQDRCTKELILVYDHEFDVSYGPQKCDIWYPHEKATPGRVEIFTHGGYWLEFTKRTYCSVVRTHLEAGAIVVMVEYTYASELPLDEVVEQVKAAIQFAAKRFPDAIISISGHSAGGHLTAKALESPEIQRIAKAAILMTPVFEVTPLLETSVGREAKMTADLARRMDVDWKKIAQFRGDILIVAVEYDAPALKKQLVDFARRLSELKSNVQTKHFDEDHFTIALKMHDVESEISQTIVGFLENALDH